MTASTQPAKLAYRINEAAEISGLSRSTLFNRIRDKKLAAKREGDRTLILHAELMRYLESLPDRETV